MMILTMCLPVLSEAASSRASIPERCFANEEVYARRRQPISNCSSQCIKRIKSDSMTKIDISIAYCKISKNDPRTKGCLYCVCNTAHSFKASNNRAKCQNDFQDDRVPLICNFAIFVPLYLILFVETYKLQRKKVESNTALRKKNMGKSGVGRGSEGGLTRCIGNRVIASLYCLLIFLATKIISGIVCGPGNMFYLVPTLFYVTIFESGLKFLMVAAVYVITAWAKIDAKMTKMSGVSSVFKCRLPSYITIPRVSDCIILLVFVSWIIHPLLRVAGKEYFLFANLCDVIFVILGGLSALIFGTELINNLKGASRTNPSATKQLNLAKAVSWGMIGIAVYSFVVIIFFGLNFVSDSSIRQIHDVTDRSYVHLCTFQLLNLFLVCCLLQIFEGKSTYKKISVCVFVCKKCSCSTCRRQETHLDTEPNIEVQSSDTISTGSSIEQDRKNANSWIGISEGSKEKQDGETHTSTDHKLPVDRRSLLP